MQIYGQGRNGFSVRQDGGLNFRMMQCAEGELDSALDYMAAHALLPAGYESISDDMVRKMGEVLMSGPKNEMAVKAMLITLAHHPSKLAADIIHEYSFKADAKLACFVRLAMEEQEGWAEQRI